MEYTIRCSRCDQEYGPKTPLFRCDACNSILEVVYEYPDRVKLRGRISHSRYKALFPLAGRLLSLREGGTPLISYSVKSVDVRLKLETKNPTKSFKDRGSSVEISKAKELGFKQVCCASTGNMGLSVATYARKFGLKCAILISKDARPEKIKKIKRQGAEIVEVEGDFNNALRTAELFAKVNNAFLCGDYHYRKEGQKSIAYEAIEQTKGEVDFIFIPVGNSTLLAAVYKGLKEFKRFGTIERFPVLVGVQSEGCDPLVRAFEKGSRVEYMHPHTVADAIAVGYPTFGFEGLKALRETDGLAVGVKDREILAAQKTLKRRGISAESGGSAAFAGFMKSYRQNPHRFRNKRVVCLVTGNN